MQSNIQLRQPGNGPNYIGAGNVVFAADTTKAVVFAPPVKDTNYAVILTPIGAAATGLRAEAPTVNGFNIVVGAAFTGTISWAVVEVTKG